MCSQGSGYLVRVASITLMLMFVGILSGCVSSSNPPPKRNFGFWKVQSGETLSEIAWKSGWNYKELAAANHIDPPYHLTVGQKVYFNKKPSKRSYVPAKKKTASSGHRKPSKSPRFAWPVKGKVVKSFNVSLNKGIDIQGQLGQPVKAAQDGVVVYAGSGLKGYGKLVIVKHGNEWLTAYAHNKKLLVTEGQQVRQGAKIAELGQQGSSALLHFEIRHLGKPVNPVAYLSK